MTCSKRALTATLSLTMLLAACNPGSSSIPPRLTGYSVVTGASATISADSAATIGAACAPGTVVMGGGVGVSGTSTAVVRTSAPITGGTGWTVTVANVRIIGGSITAVPMAVCADRPASYEIVTVNGGLNKQEVKSIEAVCPTAAHWATGVGVAGGEVRPFSQELIQQPAPERVRAGGRNYLSLPGKSSFDVFAICADFAALPKREIVLSTSVSVGPGSSARLTAACPPGKSVLHGAVGTLRDELTTIESMPASDGSSWNATVYNSETVSGSLSSRLQVVCVQTAQ